MDDQPLDRFLGRPSTPATNPDEVGAIESVEIPPLPAIFRDGTALVVFAVFGVLWSAALVFGVLTNDELPRPLLFLLLIPVFQLVLLAGTAVIVDHDRIVLRHLWMPFEVPYSEIVRIEEARWWFWGGGRRYLRLVTGRRKRWFPLFVFSGGMGQGPGKRLLRIAAIIQHQAAQNGRNVALRTWVR